MKFLRLLCRPLPGWVTLLLFTGALASASTVLPYFASGTASYGPGGNIDLGNVDARQTSPGPSDAQIYSDASGNANVLAPNAENVNLVNCTTGACNNSSKQITVAVSAAQVAAIVPMLSIYGGATASTSPGPMPPCFTISNAPCNSGYHMHHGSITIELSTTSPCPTVHLCAAFGTSNVVNFTNGAGFTGITYSCDAINNDATGEMTYAEYVNGVQFQINVFNASATALASGLNIATNWECKGV